jgi:hypothetical protein
MNKEEVELVILCSYCGARKVPDCTCPGCDQCIYGDDGGPAQPCEGWGSYCCKCGAIFALSQI